MTGGPGFSPLRRALLRSRPRIRVPRQVAVPLPVGPPVVRRLPQGVPVAARAQAPRVVQRGRAVVPPEGRQGVGSQVLKGLGVVDHPPWWR